MEENQVAEHVKNDESQQAEKQSEPPKEEKATQEREAQGPQARDEGQNELETVKKKMSEQLAEVEKQRQDFEQRLKELDELRSKASELEAENKKLAEERDRLATVEYSELVDEDRELVSDIFELITDKVLQRSIFERLQKVGKLRKKTVKTNNNILSAEPQKAQKIDSWSDADRAFKEALRKTKF